MHGKDRSPNLNFCETRPQFDKTRAASERKWHGHHDCHRRGYELDGDWKGIAQTFTGQETRDGLPRQLEARDAHRLPRRGHAWSGLVPACVNIWQARQVFEQDVEGAELCFQVRFVTATKEQTQ